MALQGTLKDFGIADIFQLIGQQGKTGVLHLLDRDQEVHVHFKDGNVVKAESSMRKKKELLGDMLVRAGLISERDLEEALEAQKRTLKRLGDILVAAGHLEREALKQMALLQTSETLYRLFFWKSGTYEFEVAEIDNDPDSFSPVRSESVLMEGFRRVDEWPMIRKRITSTSMTFERLKPLPEKPAAGADDVDDAFDAAFGGDEEGGKKEEEEEESEGEFANLGSTERMVYLLAEPGQPVQGIVDRARVGEFEACKALLNLVNLGYLKALPPASKATGVAPGSDPQRWLERMATAMARVAVFLALLGGGALVVAQLRLGPADRPERARDSAVVRHLGRAQLSRIEEAIAVFTLQKGHCPDALQQLAQAGILSDVDLRYPWGEEYYYRKKDETTYVLLPPLR